ncbi:hypothetical protein B0T20DRAFT_472431 [Sordaria brevicollis]|uniref:Uncharacterized protein n=1 Tax=Sordaria brevicollis TaxID=83679 RepID=A0AAE0P3A2_SORBR|nr:hypothetical protein B0T20DRAFT_472431 [Sordaria brevicollis]
MANATSVVWDRSFASLLSITLIGDSRQGRMSRSGNREQWQRMRRREVNRSVSVPEEGRVRRGRQAGGGRYREREAGVRMVLRREAEVGLLGARAMEWNLNGSGEQTRWKRGQVVEEQQGQGVTGDGGVWWCYSIRIGETKSVRPELSGGFCVSVYGNEDNGTHRACVSSLRHRPQGQGRGRKLCSQSVPGKGS